MTYLLIDKRIWADLFYEWDLGCPFPGFGSTNGKASKNWFFLPKPYFSIFFNFSKAFILLNNSKWIIFKSISCILHSTAQLLLSKKESPIILIGCLRNMMRTLFWEKRLVASIFQNILNGQWRIGFHFYRFHTLWIIHLVCTHNFLENLMFFAPWYAYVRVGIWGGGGGGVKKKSFLENFAYALNE